MFISEDLINLTIYSNVWVIESTFTYCKCIRLYIITVNVFNKKFTLVYWFFHTELQPLASYTAEQEYILYVYLVANWAPIGGTLSHAGVVAHWTH